MSTTTMDRTRKGLYDELKGITIGKMTFIGIAITVSWSYSLAVTFGLPGMDFYCEMATLIVIMLIGHYFEMKSAMGASRSLELLVEMIPSLRTGLWMEKRKRYTQRI